MSWKIRPAICADAGTLSAIDTLASTYPWTEQQFLPGCDGSGGTEHTLLVEHLTRVVGFVVYHCVLDEASIFNVAVHPLQQRQGLARRLLAAALNAALERGASSCHLDVRESNTGARNLYSGMGFTVDGIRKNYYRSSQGRENSLLMSKIL